MRARLALAVSGQAYELREVVLRNKPAALLAASAKATVPVLVLPDGKVIDQSLDIMLWALRLNDPANWLNPPAATLGEMLALVAGNDTDFKHQLDRYKYPNRWLAGLEAKLSTAAAESATPAWLYGESARLADMAVLPFVRQFAHTDALWFAAQDWPQLQAWLTNFEASALYGSVMGRADAWTGAPSLPTTENHGILIK